MTDIHFIGGEKGGVGKSLVARVLAQYLIDHDRPLLGFDTDRSHGALMRFYADYASPALVDNVTALDAIIEAAVDQPQRCIVVDLAAQTHAPLAQWMEDTGVLGLAAELGLRLHYWHVMDCGRDAVDLLATVLDRFGADINYVLVRNEVRGGDFRLLDSSAALARALELGARTVRLKRLHENAINKIDAASCSFWRAVTASGPAGAGLGLMDRQRVKIWLRDAYGELAALGI